MYCFQICLEEVHMRPPVEIADVNFWYWQWKFVTTVPAHTENALPDMLKGHCCFRGKHRSFDLYESVEFGIALISWQYLLNPLVRIECFVFTFHLALCEVNASTANILVDSILNSLVSQYVSTWRHFHNLLILDEFLGIFDSALLTRAISGCFWRILLL